MSISDRDAGRTQWIYPVPPGPAQEAPFIFCGVISTVARLALPQSRKSGSQSQHSRHSAKNQKWWIQWSQGGALAVSAEENLGGETVPAPIVEPTWAAFGTN